jgi:CheY-like chemotaxis protein
VVVEDGREDAVLIRHAVESAGIRNPVIVFPAARDVRRHFDEKSHAELPALFILDVFLVGDETGIDLLRWIRQQRAPLGTTPAMILTGSSQPRHQEDAALLGSVYFLVKPVNADTISAAVRSLGMVVSALGSEIGRPAQEP